MNPHPTREELGSPHLIEAARMSNRAIDQIRRDTVQLEMAARHLREQAEAIDRDGLAAGQFPTTATGRPLIDAGLLADIARNVALVNACRDIIAIAADERT
jgi:lactate dehydrogenase-like 2-hydroxyacid dehydrogenase